MSNTPQSFPPDQPAGEWTGGYEGSSTTTSGTGSYSDVTTPATGAYSGSGSPSATDVAKDQAKEVAGTAGQAGQQVAQTAVSEAQNVVSEVSNQGRQLVSQTLDELRGQASGQQQRLAGGVRSLTDDLRSMASGNGGGGGLAAELATQVAQRGQQVADWLENKQPADLLDEVRTFARRRPGAFLGIAAATGLVLGRLTRSLAAEAKDAHDQSTGSSYGSGSPSYATGSYSTPSYSTGTTGYDSGYSASGSGYADVPASGYQSGYSSGTGLSDASLQEVPTSGTGASGTSYDPAGGGYADPLRGDDNR